LPHSFRWRGRVASRAPQGGAIRTHNPPHPGEIIKSFCHSEQRRKQLRVMKMAA